MPKTITPPFGGFPSKGYSRQIPASIISPQERSLTNYLPEDLRARGYELLQIDEEAHQVRDPYVLYNEWGEILTEWEREPTYGELLDMIVKSN